MTLETLTQPPKKGDKLLIKSDIGLIQLLDITKVIVTENETTIHTSPLSTINFNSFLSGTSWVKEAFIIS